MTDRVACARMGSPCQLLNTENMAQALVYESIVSNEVSNQLTRTLDHSVSVVGLTAALPNDAEMYKVSTQTNISEPDISWR